jgi:hypothetical protein
MNDDDLTAELGRTLSEHADVMHGSPLHLADVQGRARSIRRRRTATAVVGVAAAVALIVPTAALAGHQGHRDVPLPPATQSVTPTTPTSSPSATGSQPPLGVLDVSDLPTGAPPAVDYVADGRMHVAGGGAYQVGTGQTPDQFVELADGSIVWRTTDGNGFSYVQLRDPDGNYHDPVHTTSDLRVNPAHSIVAWLASSGQVTIFEGWASQPRPLGVPVPGQDLRLGPVDAPGETAPGQTGPDCAQASCSVVVNVRDTQRQPWEVSESGSQPLRDGGYLEVNDVSADGLSVGFTKVTDTMTCSRLLGGGEFQGFDTCGVQLLEFSPDGQRIMALPSYSDGAGPSGIYMYDLEGRLFGRMSTLDTQATIGTTVWEDDTHLLASVYEGGDWALVRFGSDGSMEYAVPPAPGADVTDNPFVLPTGGGLPG